MVYLDLNDLSSEFDLWATTPPAVNQQYDQASTLCGAQIWQAVPFGDFHAQEALFIGTDCADHYYRFELTIPMSANTQYLEATGNFDDCSYSSGALVCDFFVFQGTGSNAFAILTQHGFNLHSSGWSYTYQVFTTGTTLEVYSGQGSSSDLFIALPVPLT